jgi:hypothetical protein
MSPNPIRLLATEARGTNKHAKTLLRALRAHQGRRGSQKRNVFSPRRVVAARQPTV